MKYELKNAVMQIAADTFGAELVSVVCGGKERLWQNPTGEWSGHAPVLFPVCGNCGITVKGTTYPVLPHGFAKRSEFVLTEKSDNALTFSLSASKETRRVYPYDFRFTVTYRTEGNKLTVGYEVSNVGKVPLYASCGGHESFALEGGIGDYLLEFPQEETFISLLHDGDGRLTGGAANFGAGRMLRLPKEFLREGRTLIFRVKSRSARLRRADGTPVARVTFEGFPYLLLWRPLDAPMICIEPWHNLPDGKTEREFAEKEGVFCVEPRNSARFVRSIEYF